jgi:hypothetical protein
MVRPSALAAPPAADRARALPPQHGRCIEHGEYETPLTANAAAPDPIVPRQGLTRTQVAERFEEQRIAIVNFARETQMALKEHTVVHPFPIFGTLNAYQWLIYAPLHTMRHEKQIAAVKATPGYPSTSH